MKNWKKNTFGFISQNLGLISIKLFYQILLIFHIEFRISGTPPHVEETKNFICIRIRVRNFNFIKIFIKHQKSEPGV